ncbi:SMP-30/gluconolactonase/LRE family protein [Mesorhizobium sp. 8]|uniref:SMP-30/gluconolactonase/LRE family protein n=1 Tax=Mesorhizobium sp. 8 TaxID=2584466 RepID=UPI0011225F8E|nr:SMP-30/gluconolactonase/LRE family protein [Mesorhizobium sp. 8]QDC03314.1 SMP-30/gluconolactonase/LRE family protein [Mesorhizobium sp. 8]
MTLAASTIASRALADFTTSARYPDPAVRALDPSFSKYMVFFAAVEQVYRGDMAYTEGPCYFGDYRFLLWTEIPSNRILKWDETTGKVSVFREPSNYANGLTRDNQGRLIAAEHGRKVTRTEYDGSITVLADSFEGKPLNSPNDVVVASDDSVWFTDPPFGIAGNFSGVKAKSELPNNVYRIDPASGAITVAAGDVKAPNGLCFSPDEKLMYVVDSAAKPVTIRAYDVAADKKSLSNGRVFFTCGEGEAPDGIRCDVDGNVWAAYGAVKPGWDGVLCIDPGGKAIGHIGLPERAANLTFGGPKRNRLYMTTGRAIYSLYVNTQGATGA